jgi:hypothetical protein
MTSNVIQLQNICNQVTVYNYSSETIPGPITLEILTNGIPIGFSLIYQTNISCKPNESVSLTRKNPNSSTEDSRKRTTDEPYGITLAAGITINGNHLNNNYLPINLETGLNGVLATSKATGIYPPLNIRTQLKLDYTYVRNSTLYKWSLINIGITFGP